MVLKRKGNTRAKAVLSENKGAYLRMRTQMATKEYANKVPIDMRSTRAAKSNKRAIRAVRRRNKTIMLQIFITCLCHMD